VSTSFGWCCTSWDSTGTPNSSLDVTVSLRNGVAIEQPLALALGFLEAYGPDAADPSGPVVFGEADLRLANRQGARISAAQIAAILRRRREIERALSEIVPDASLAGPAEQVPWPPLRQLFDAFAGIHGVGLSKMTKALHRKRPALIPMLDSIVQAYLVDDDAGPKAPFAERAIALVRGYKRDLDRNRRALRAVERELARRDYDVSAVRLLDILIVTTPLSLPPAPGGPSPDG
jgi:hypothetical protein